MEKIPISLIIPFSRPEFFRSLLKRIQAIQYKGQYEVVVVINSTKEWVPPGDLGKRVKLIWSNQKGPSAARNAGIQAANFPYHVFTDDDCEFKPNLLDLYDQSWRDNPSAVIIGGRVKAIIKGQSNQTTTQQKLLLANYGWCYGLLDYGSVAHACTINEPLFTANFGIKQNLNKKWYFSESLGRVTINGWLLGAEDCLLSYQKILGGKLVWYNPVLEVANVVTADRFSNSYIVRRVFLAGIERLIMDQLLSGYSNWKDYPTQLKTAVQEFFVGRYSNVKSLLNWDNYVFSAGYLYWWLFFRTTPRQR